MTVEVMVSGFIVSGGGDLGRHSTSDYSLLWGNESLCMGVAERDDEGERQTDRQAGREREREIEE